MKRFLLSIFVFLFVIISVEASKAKDHPELNIQDKKSLVIKAHESALEHDKAGKTKKAIADLEKILDLAKTCGDEDLLEKTYEFLITFHQKSGSVKKADEYKYLLNLIRAAVEKQNLESKNKQNEVEMGKLREQTTHAELDRKETEYQLNEQTQKLLQTKDSLGILDLINKERLSKIDLLTKEKELEDLKVQEQEMKLKNQELVIKEKEAHERFIMLVIIGLVVGIVIVGALAYFIYKNLQQKKQYSKEKEMQLEVIQHQHQNITNSINYARKIQNAMLPPEDSFLQLFNDSFILLKPKDIVSGDFYWFINVCAGGINDFKSNGVTDLNNNADEKIIVVAADCTGHGVPGALMSMIGFNLLNMIVYNHIHEPDLILTELNNNIRLALKQDKTDNKDGMDMALCVIDKKKKVIEYAGAKNPLIVIKNGELEHLKGDKHPIGGSQGEAHRTYTKHSISIGDDTSIYMFSDGYEDQFGGPENKKFMIKNLKELLLKIHQEPFAQQKEILNKTIEEWKGTKEKQIDDILVMGMKIS